MIVVLCFIFFLSGASALLFETLWFRLAGITLGNSVWAGSVVLASFMGGLALGNGLAARYGQRIARPLAAYARLEVAIAVTGVGLVLLLPRLSGWLAPLFRPVFEEPWLVNPLRLLVAFLLLLVPTTAMGWTLPLLVRELFAVEANFGRVLGRLYGWNTLGAVAGALAGEVALIGWLGLRGTAYVAGALDLIVAAAALAIARRRPARAALPVSSPSTRLSSASRWLLLGSFLAGGILLALEVVWFRFLQLFVVGTSFSFAVMLATVLAGIGAGGLLASWWSRLRPDAHRHLVAVALAAGVATLGAYAAFVPPPAALAGHPENAWPMARLALSLMLPVSVLSGMLFTLFGHAAHDRIGVESRSAGLLALANTIGAMLGALVGGFVLLPLLGLERSFLLLGLAYAAVAACAWSPVRRSGSFGWTNGVVAAVLLLLLATFPFGSMQAHLDAASRPYRERFQSRTVAVREGLTETIQYLQRDFLGETLNHRLMTNAYSMSGDALDSKRYMKFFVYWPVALHRAPRRALLIGFGAGSTAKALTDTRALDEIHVVDISRDILELSEIAFPDPRDNPLNDPRVHVHVEDGRYFLQTTELAFDIVTAEPPPPTVGGAVNLYTREYFELIHERLAAGGIVTYWLPVMQTTLPTTRSMLAAFCAAFEDCSLWAGANLDWVMAGSRDATGPVDEGSFVAQWQDPVVGPEMRALGLERPEQLGATLIADATRLAALVGDAPPVVDDRPLRLGLRPASPADNARYGEWMDPTRAREHFAGSSLIARLWPPELRARTLPYFDDQRVANMQVYPNDPNVVRIVDELLAADLRTAALWLMGSSVDHERIAMRAAASGRTAEAAHYLGARAIVAERFQEALEHLAHEPRKWPPLADALRVYALCRLGRTAEAAALARAPEAGGFSCW